VHKDWHVSIVRVWAILIASIVSCCALAASAVGSAGWTVYHRQGFTISVPSSWQPVPATPAKTAALAAKLRAEGKLQLAGQYAAYAKDKYQWNPPRLFRAFQWPEPPVPIDTDVLVERFASGGYPLQALAHAFVSVLRRKDPGSRTSAPVHMSGFAEDSYRIESRTKLDKTYGAKASYTLLYMFEQGKALYQVAVRGEAGLGGGYQHVADQIAATFRFS
jgi:hypothetical protein